MDVLFKYLQSQKLMSISTYHKDLWIATVYYAVDKEFNFYFVSKPYRAHCLALDRNPKVACCIYDSNQKVTDKKIGIQMTGKASIIRGLNVLKTAIIIWGRVNPGVEKVLNFKNITTDKVKSRFYKIKAEKIRFFNEELYGKKEYEDFKLH